MAGLVQSRAGTIFKPQEQRAVLKVSKERKRSSRPKGAISGWTLSNKFLRIADHFSIRGMQITDPETYI